MSKGYVKCRKCKTLFDVAGNIGQLCPKCIQAEEETYQKVRKYIKDKPGVLINEVSEALNVPPSKIMGYIREERLEIVNKNIAVLTCKNCGKIISSGMFCESCKKFTTERLVKKEKIVLEAYPGESIRYN